jgi:hypothetical protein
MSTTVTLSCRSRGQAGLAVRASVELILHLRDQVREAPYALWLLKEYRRGIQVPLAWETLNTQQDEPQFTTAIGATAVSTYLVIAFSKHYIVVRYLDRVSLSSAAQAR